MKFTTQNIHAWLLKRIDPVKLVFFYKCLFKTAPYFLKNTNFGAETCLSKKALTWNRGTTAISAYRINGSATGNGSFNATNWTFSGGTSFYYYVDNGVLF